MIGDIVKVKPEVIDAVTDRNIRMGFIVEARLTLELKRTQATLRIKAINDDFVHIIYKGVPLTFHKSEVKKCHNPVRRF